VPNGSRAMVLGGAARRRTRRLQRDRGCGKSSIRGQRNACVAAASVVGHRNWALPREMCPLLAQLQISNVILIHPLRSHHHTQLRIFFENGCDVLCPPDGSPESVAEVLPGTAHDEATSSCLPFSAEDRHLSILLRTPIPSFPVRLPSHQIPTIFSIFSPQSAHALRQHTLLSLVLSKVRSLILHTAGTHTSLAALFSLYYMLNTLCSPSCAVEG